MGDFLGSPDWMWYGNIMTSLILLTTFGVLFSLYDWVLKLERNAKYDNIHNLDQGIDTYQLEEQSPIHMTVSYILEELDNRKEQIVEDKSSYKHGKGIDESIKAESTLSYQETHSIPKKDDTTNSTARNIPELLRIHGLGSVKET